MKTKKFFMLLAVVLLSGASAFAQSESETLKGDVNEDGVVDVADINAVIEIMKAGGGVVEPPTYYFSIGTTVPDASNYTTVNNATTTIPTTIRYTSTQRNYHYILIPSNKTISIVADSDNAPINFTEQTSISIPNHKVYKTDGPLNVGGTVRITLSDVQPTYYFSVGTTAPDATNYTTVNNATTDIPTTIRYSPTQRNYHYILIPSNKTITIVDDDDNAPINFTEQTSISIPNHKVYKTNGALNPGGTVRITLSDVQPTYYWYIGKDEALLGKSGTSYDLDLTKLPTVSSINDIYSDSQPVGDIENNIYVVCPTEWVGQFKLTTTSDFEIPQTDKTSQITSGVTGYSILRGNGKFAGSIIKVVKI